MPPATLSRKARAALQAKSDLAAGPRGSTPSRPCHSTLRAGDHSAVSKQRLLCRANVISAADQHEEQQVSSRRELSADTWNLYKDCMFESLRGENKWRIPLFLSRCFLKLSGSGCPPALGQRVCPAARGWCLMLRGPWDAPWEATWHSKSISHAKVLPKNTRAPHPFPSPRHRSLQLIIG